MQGWGLRPRPGCAVSRNQLRPRGPAGGFRPEERTWQEKAEPPRDPCAPTRPHSHAGPGWAELGARTTPTDFPRAVRPRTLPAPQSPVTLAQRENPRRTPGPAACGEPEELKFNPTPASTPASTSNSQPTSPGGAPAGAPALPLPARRSRGAQ